MPILMPNVGDVLNDKSLSDISDPVIVFFDSEGVIPENEEGNKIRSRVLYWIDGSSGKPFKSLSPPPTHLFLDFRQRAEHAVRVHLESLEYWLTSSNPPSLLLFLDLNSIEVKSELLSPSICTFLRNLPPRGTHLCLWAVGFDNDTEEMEEIVDALLASQCQVDFLGFDGITFNSFLSPQYLCKLGGRCRSVHLPISLKSGQDAAFSLLSNLMSSPACKLLELHLTADDHSWRAYDPRTFGWIDDQHMSGISRALSQLGGCKKLQRLDLSELPPLGAEGMSMLVACIASPSCAIHDLGINLSSTRRSHLKHGAEADDDKAGFSILAHAFQSGSSLSKLKALRFSYINTNEAANCVVEILGCPQSNCKVKLLDISIYKYDDDDEPFFKRLRQGIIPRIKCLKVTFLLVVQEYGRLLGSSSITKLSDWEDWLFKNCRVVKESQRVSELSSLSDFLSSDHCSLLWLQCIFDGIDSIDESLQTMIANSLEANHLLTYLQISGCSRAAAFLARNRLYESMGLSEEHCMKAQVGRLFLCGHGEVGKTTLRKSLVKLHSHHASTSSPSTYDCSFFNKLFSPCRRVEVVEPRTRGLEIHQLCFESAQKLAIFDLGGQPDYHIFHHYFMTNTSHDLFMIIGKYTSSKKHSELDVELEYWLRFVVSHRNSVHGPKPRIILVVNFFDTKEVDDMQVEAEELTQDLRDKYAQDLDFSGVFGIVALNKREVQPILRNLERLLEESLNHKPMIPKLCHNLLVHTLPQLASHKKQFPYGIHLCRKAHAGKLFVEYSQVKAMCMHQQEQQGSDDQHPQIEDQASNMLEKRIQAALVELHNTGEVIFFPPIVGDGPILSKENEVVDEHALVAVKSPSISQNTKDLSPIIIDPNLFCNKVIGNLLTPEVLSGNFQWEFKDIKQVLMKNECPKQYVAEVLKYLCSLELCYAFHNIACKQNTFFFPAVARDRTLQWPSMFTSQTATAGKNENSTHFYGRRIKCMDTERHLIPSGVFSRLQVKLSKFCRIGNDRSYKLGYHWVSFVTQNISVMVRFGRVATVSDIQDANQASNMGQMHTRPLSIRMKEDDHPEWIDILLCCPSLPNDQQQATSVEYSIMNGIKRLIFDICQAISRGIPTVALEECVLRYEAQKHAMPLTEVKSSINEKGLAGSVAWEDQESIYAVHLLLPEELQDHVMRHVQVVQEIQEEFATTWEEEKGGGKEEESDKDELVLYQQLHGDHKVLYDLLISQFNTRFERLGAKMDNIMQLVKEIKQDVHKVMDGLRQAEMRIVANCSTRLLTQVLLQGVLPSFPYLTNSKGKLEQLKNFLLRRKATIHFLCESFEEGPHEVKGQIGKKVVVEKGILMKMAPFLVPTLMVLCCAARFVVANKFLPGVAPLIFSPLLDCLKSIGITDQDLQSKIMPKALNILFDELDVKIQQLYDPKSPLLNFDEQQRKEGVEALQEFLGSIENIDMRKEFGLYFVQVGHETHQLVKARWLCKEHAHRYTNLRHPQNPFSLTSK